MNVLKTLYFKNGSSDKIYQVELQQVNGGYLVNFAYGRRGSALKAGTKTNTPVALEKATDIMDGLLKGKMSKGYTPGVEGKPFQNTTNAANVTGINPQLLNTISLDEANKLMVNSNYCMQEKWDGRRILVKNKNNNVIGVNKKGLAVAITLELEAATTALGDCLLDGEFMGDFLVVFDLLETSKGDIRGEPYYVRLKKLEELIPKNTSVLRLVKTAFTTKEKHEMFQQLNTTKKEGVTFKDMQAAFEAGRPASGGSQLKYKFYAENSFIVSKINDSRSVGLQVYDKGVLTNVGNVTIPPNMDIPQLNDIIEVVYLYAYKGGSIYQPKNPRVRTDADASDCQMDKLKFKAEIDE